MIARLLAVEAARILAVETQPRPGGDWALQACGVSTFVAPRVFQAEFDAPQPFFLMRLLTAADENPSVLLDLEGVARANAGPGQARHSEFVSPTVNVSRET